jgi:hypothetical protein
MAKKTVNIGTSVNKGDGDPLRTAFGKINDNFDEIYGAIGADGSIFNPLNVDSHLLPDADNTRDLGSPTKRWRDIFVAPGSLYIGDIKLSNDNGKLVATKVINPGEANEAPDPTDSDAGSEIGSGGGGLSVSDFGRGFTDTLDAGKITTSKLYNRPSNLALNNHFVLEVTDGGVVALPDGSIINGATLKTIAGNYAGITAGPASPAGKDEDSWVWVDNNGAAIATKYSTDAHTWTFNNDGDLTLPAGGDIKDSTGNSVLGGNANTGNFTFSNDTISNDNGLLLDTNRGSLAIGTNMEVPGVAQHFHIAFNGSNSNPPVNDLFFGDDYNYVKLPGSELDPDNTYGVEIGTEKRDGPQNVVVDAVDELVPPGGVWRLFILIEDYPNLGSAVSVGDTVTTSWGTPITATVTGVVEAVVDGDWQIQVDQDITAGFSAGPKQVSFGASGLSHTWRFGTDGELTFPNGALKIAGNTISNYVFNDLGGGTGLGAGSQLEVSQTKTVITHGTTNSLSEGGPSLTSQSLFEVNSNKILSAFQVINTLDDTSLINEVVTELNSNGFQIGQRTTNDLGDSSEPLVAFNGWTFGTVGQQQALTFPDATVQTTAYTGEADVNLLSSASSIEVETGDADRWFIRLRREDDEQNPEFKGVTVLSTNYDSGGNAIVVAQLDLGQSGDGIVVAKFTSAGVLVWKKSIGAIGGAAVPSYPESNAVIDSDDNILLAINQDESQIKIIVKINGTTGAVIFSRVIELTSSFSIRAMALDSSNNIIIGGHFYFNESDNVAFVAKLNSTADNIIWQKSLMVDSGESYINSVAVDFNNDIIAVGTAEVERTVNGSTFADQEMLVVKITSVGGLGWQKVMRLDSETPFGLATNVSVDSVGNIYVTGTYYVDAVDSDNFPNDNKSNAVVLFKISTLGVMVWDRRVGPGPCSWIGASTAVGDDGDLYLLAYTVQRNPAYQADNNLAIWTSALALARYNKTTGAVIWQSYFDNPQTQDIPGSDAPWSDYVVDNIAVQGNKILIGGSVRLGESNIEIGGGPFDASNDYFTQGFLAQFDTAATKFTAEGWTLSTSRIPGRLMNTLVAVTGPTQLQTDIAITAEGAGGIATQAVGISVRRTASRVNTWTFGKDGTFTAPADADIRLQQQQLGWATLYGRFPNNDDDIWFESMCHDAEGFAYVVGSDYWAAGNRAHIYKFTPEGSAVWQRELRSGTGAQFTVEIIDGVYATPTVTYGGDGYKVGDRILIDGGNLGGDGSNTLVLEVATIINYTDYVGQVGTVTIVSGTAVAGSNTYTGRQDYDDNAECEVRSMTYNPVTGNIEVIITTATTMGDANGPNSIDSSWSETVIVTIDSGSGTVVSTRTLQDESDVYAYDIDVSSTGKIAVVGEKFNEYTEYGAITPLAGSGVDTLWVAKSDIDAEHFPGEDIPGGSYIQDWWITGTGITDQTRVSNVNIYYNLATTTTSAVGSGATITVTFNPTTGALVDTNVTANGSDYAISDTITISGLLLAGGTSPANNIVFTVNSVLAGGGVNSGSIAWTSGAHPSTHLNLQTLGSINFAAGGAAFAIKQNLGGEAFVWTPDFTKAIGGAVSDQFSGVVWNAAGTSLYAVGRGRYEVNYNQALVVKFSSTGTITASKFVNDGMGENNAYNGAVALMANDSIVVVHEQYNNDRDEADEVLVTKLDSSLNIVWQQFIGVNNDPNGNSWSSPNGKISVAVDPATDEILLAWHAYNDEVFNDDAIYFVKLDTDGEVIWKRIWGVHESDVRISYMGYGNRALSIHGDQFTLVGYADAPDDNQDNGFIVTLPLDGTGVGEHGIWTYVEPKDDIVKVWRLSDRTSTTFTATEHSGGITAVADIKYYYTDYPSEEFTFYPETILSNAGGAIEFADGSRQTFSTAIVPQVKISAGRYTLRPEDSGRHILIETINYAVIIPNWQKVVLPVGYTVTLVNISGTDAYVENESSDTLQGEMWSSGGDMKTAYIGIRDNGSGQMITLIKIKEGTRSNDAEDHGDIWMVAGADIYNND